MGLLIRVISAEIHRADDLLDERDLIRGDAVFGVEVLVRPQPRPLLSRYESIDLTCGVLRWLVQKDQKASQPTGEVRQNTPGLGLRVERADTEIGL